MSERAAVFDLSACVKLRVAGGDRVRFLNGQVTADVRKATTSSAIEMCVLDPKGKMNAHGFLFDSADSFLLDADPELVFRKDPARIWEELLRRARAVTAWNPG